jgi:hypothetical protein
VNLAHKYTNKTNHQLLFRALKKVNIAPTQIIQILPKSQIPNTKYPAPAPGLPSFWPTQQTQRLAGGKALGELGANNSHTPHV